MKKEWKTELFIILFIILFSLLAHHLFNLFFVFLSLGFGLLLLHHYYQLLYFPQSFIDINEQKSLQTYKPIGIWGKVYQQLAHFQKSSFDHRLQQRKERYRLEQIFTQFPHALLILNESMHVSWFNPSCKTIFKTQKYILKHHISKLIEHPVINEYLLSANFENPLEIESPIEKSTILSLQFFPLVDCYGETLLLIEDITATFHINQTRKDFISNVTHELKTPLTVFFGFLEPMCEDIEEFPEHWGRNINLMYQQSLRMNHIVNDMLLLSKLEVSDNPASVQVINMALVLKNAVNDAQLLSRDNVHEISHHIDENLFLLGDENDLKVIVNNLMVNAIKYTPQRTRISLSWFVKSNQAYLVISDSGEGIAARHLSRLTERFYRVESDRSREKGGTGLGLAIVNHALQRHQGKLEISSEIGRGTTFKCIFPEKRSICR